VRPTGAVSLGCFFLVMIPLVRQCVIVLP